VPDEITRSVTVAIEPAVARAEQIRASRTLPEILGAWEAHQRGPWQRELVDAASNLRAREWFERAIALDPGFAARHAWIVHTWLNEVYVYLSRDRAEGVALAEAHGLRALALDPQDASAYAALAWTSTADGDLGLALMRCDQALALHPNHVEAQRCRAGAPVWSGRLQEGRDVADDAQRELNYLALVYRAWHANHQHSCRQGPISPASLTRPLPGTHSSSPKPGNPWCLWLPLAHLKLKRFAALVS